jgi:hypothetical protein
LDLSIEASHLDGERLRAVVGSLRQGDILGVARVTTFFSPDSPSFPEDAEHVGRDEPVATVERRLPSGLSAVLSQTCDLRRLPSIEPYVVLAPLSTVPVETYREAKDGLSVRYFAVGEVVGHEDKGQLVIDARLLCSIEKVALLSSHIERIESPFSDVRREDLRDWLGQRFGRPAFPDEIVTGVVAPIEQAVKRVREKEDTAGVFRSAVWMGLSCQHGKRYASLLVLLDPALRAANKVQAQDIDLVLNRLRKALSHFAGRAGAGYSIVADIHDVTERPATDILSREELAFDLEAVEV